MSRKQVQVPNLEAAARTWLDRQLNLPETAREALANTAARLVIRVQTEGTSTIGLCGAPGTGKSTLASLLRHLLENCGTPAFTLGLDDYYLPLTRRRELSEQIHPLCLHRGVPGTHDLDLLRSDFDHLLNGNCGQAVLPRFDKSRDDRSAATRQAPGRRPEVLIFEGWIVASKPPSAIPDNDFLREYDAAGHWRRFVLQHWRRLHDDFRQRLQETWYLEDPGWQQVIQWRREQETRLQNPRLDSREKVTAFLDTFKPVYELTRAQMPGLADVSITLDRNHIVQIKEERK